MDIRGLTADSREVAPGYLFAALPGTRLDGARFIPEAVRRGATAILAGPQVDFEALGLPATEELAIIRDANPRQALSLMAAAFYGAQPETIVAVTGTNGKTSVAGFVRQIWTEMDKAAASLGTLGVVESDQVHPLRHTTPDPVEIHRVLKGLADRGVDHLALEASSHGLAQYRLDGVRLKAAAFTNLTQDHLDYHASFEDYFFSKLRLFAEVLPPAGVAVLNADSRFFSEIEAVCWGRGQPVLAVGRAAPAKGRHLQLVDSRPEAEGQILTCRWDEQTHEVHLPLVGGFQASNALLAAGLVLACGGGADQVFAALEHLHGAPGRMQFVGRTRNGARVFVDYAHTPDALSTVLKALRPHTQGRLHVVFGAGGDRDQAKRPLMGEAAQQEADVIIVTDDNPRHEDPAAIRRAILQTAPKAQEIGDRAQAIETAIRNLRAGDVLVIAGKGHETGQVVGDEVRPFSDVAHVERLLPQDGGV